MTAHTTNTPSVASFEHVTLNHAPVLSPISNRTASAGVPLLVTNSTADPDVPPQTLTYALLQSPGNASIDTASGLIAWRPGVMQAGTSNLFTVQVADNGSPGLSATQSFGATVNPVSRPAASQAAVVGGYFQFQVQGDSGPDYSIQSATNLANPLNWTTIWSTNSPHLPFIWSMNTAGAPASFYRVAIGP